MRSMIKKYGDSFYLHVPMSIAKEHKVEDKCNVDVEEMNWHRILGTIKKKDD